MNLTSILILIQMVSALLLQVQQNPNLPISFKQTVISTAQLTIKIGIQTIDDYKKPQLSQPIIENNPIVKNEVKSSYLYPELLEPPLITFKKEDFVTANFLLKGNKLLEGVDIYFFEDKKQLQLFREGNNISFHSYFPLRQIVPYKFRIWDAKGEYKWYQGTFQTL